MIGSSDSTIFLNNGVRIPYLGFGTWRLVNGKECENTVQLALNAGYRLIDTAAQYENEESVGKAIAKSGIDRKKLFVTTKLWREDLVFAQKRFEESLKQLGLDYVDLYLIHWPEKDRLKAWKVLESLNKSGSCRCIGVSNFTIRHLDELLSVAEIVPCINQVEFSPYLFQKELLDYCRSKGIQVEAYSPLTRATKLRDPRLIRIAQTYHKSPAQLLLRWSLQHSLVTIPKAAKKTHLAENLQVFDFEISPEHMQEMNSWNENLRMTSNPEKFP